MEKIGQYYEKKANAALLSSHQTIDLLFFFFTVYQ